MTQSKNSPDWPPATSAGHYPEGFTAYGSTGQLFKVKDKQWVRVRDKPNREPGPPIDHPGHC